MDPYDRSPPSSGGGRRRLIGFLIIVAIAFVMYFANTETNPITGEKQHVSLSPKQEIQLGLQSAPEMAAQMGGEVSSNDPKAREVQRIGYDILQNSRANKGPWKYQFHLLKDPKVINAFALPGGQIFITTGLLNELQTEAQLAGVLAHEMGHVIQRHSAQQMAKSQLGQMLVTAVGVGASDDSQRAYQAAMIAGMVNQMTQLHYSRKDELEADQWGLILMSEAGYDPKAMIEVMKILEKSDKGGHKPEMLLTHPYPESRIEKINEYLSKHPPEQNQTEGRDLNQVW